ncbi:hypothetical protein [Calothrix sp. NIES-2100]
MNLLLPQGFPVLPDNMAVGELGNGQFKTENSELWTAIAHNCGQCSIYI